MTAPTNSLASATEVLTLFLIPIGGGIPAGVILAEKSGLRWHVTALIYLVSDIILACVFEAIMNLFIKRARHSAALRRIAEAYKAALNRTGMQAALTPTPLSLIILSFGVDPMTGRAAARAAGHGFIAGWTFAICGDMIFFALIMASTLWLNNLFGDGTMAATVVTVAMIAVMTAPNLFKRWRGNRPRD